MKEAANEDNFRHGLSANKGARELRDTYLSTSSVISSWLLVIGVIIASYTSFQYANDLLWLLPAGACFWWRASIVNQCELNAGSAEGRNFGGTSSHAICSHQAAAHRMILSGFSLAKRLAVTTVEWIYLSMAIILAFVVVGALLFVGWIGVDKIFEAGPMWVCAWILIMILAESKNDNRN